MVIPLFYLIGMYEKNFHRKTLINQLIYYMMMNCFFGNIIFQSSNIILYLSGPLSKEFCYQLTMSFPTFTNEFLLLTDAVSITRYVFVFYLKNPTVLQEDFWARFILVWIVGFSIFSQVAIMVGSPGRDPNETFVCIGHISAELEEIEPKKNLPIFFVAIFTITLHLITTLNCLGYHKMTNHHISDVTTNIRSLTIANRVAIVEKSNLIYTIMSIVAALLMCFGMILPITINSMTLKALTSYPNFLLLYVFHLLLAPTINVTIIMMLVLKNENLLKFLQSKIRKIFFFQN